MECVATQFFLYGMSMTEKGFNKNMTHLNFWTITELHLWGDLYPGSKPKEFCHYIKKYKSFFTAD